MARPRYVARKINTMDDIISHIRHTHPCTSLLFAEMKEALWDVLFSQRLPLFIANDN